MTISGKTGIIACTVDRDTKFQVEALRWFATLTRIAGVEPSDLFINVVGGGDSPLLRYLASEGVNLQQVEPFDERWPYCNKISGALALVGKRADGPIVLTDADTAFLADPRSIEVEAGTIRGRPVDAAVPPLLTILNVYDLAGFDLPRVCSASRVHEPTITSNLNGGFLLLHPDDLEPLATRWHHWANWLLNSGALGDPPLYAGQVSTALAITDLGLDVSVVGPEWNLATHSPEWNRAQLAAPLMVHYHRHLQDGGLLAFTGASEVDAQIQRINAAIFDEFQAVLAETEPETA